MEELIRMRNRKKNSINFRVVKQLVRIIIFCRCRKTRKERHCQKSVKQACQTVYYLDLIAPATIDPISTVLPVRLI